MHEIDGREWGTTREAAGLLGVTVETARVWAQSGRFDCAGRRAWCKVAGRYRVDFGMVRGWWRRQAREPPVRGPQKVRNIPENNQPGPYPARRQNGLNPLHAK